MSTTTWGCMSPGGRRAYVNVVEGELVARDAQGCSVSLREAAEGEPAEIVSNVILEAGDDRHKAG